MKKKDSKIIKMLIAKKESPFLDIGESLVRIGFAKISPVDHLLLKETEDYCKLLHSAELYALKKKLGMKYYWIPVKDILNNLLLKFVNYGKDLVGKVVFDVRNMPAKLTPAQQLIIYEIVVICLQVIAAFRIGQFFYNMEFEKKDFDWSKKSHQHTLFDFE